VGNVANVVFVGCTGVEDFRGRVKAMGTIVCVITESTILISAQFNIWPHYSFMVQNQITVSLCLTIAVCQVLHSIVCFEVVRLAILATAWLLVYLLLNF